MLPPFSPRPRDSTNRDSLLVGAPHRSRTWASVSPVSTVFPLRQTSVSARTVLAQHASNAMSVIVRMVSLPGRTGSLQRRVVSRIDEHRVDLLDDLAVLLRLGRDLLPLRIVAELVPVLRRLLAA